MVAHLCQFNYAMESEQLDELYTWVDQVALSRPKRNIARDFSDGVLFAELLWNYFPKKVEVHNYPTASSLKAKFNNWNTLNAKVLSKLEMELPSQLIDQIVNAKPLAIQRALSKLKDLVETFERAAPQGTVRTREQDSELQERGRTDTQITGTDKLRLIYKLLTERIESVQRSIRRKEQNIQELELLLSQHS